MATITLRLEDQVKDDLEALARSRGITVTDLLRPLVEEAAGRPASESRSVHPAHLTAVERRTMSLLHQVLGKLDAEDKNYHRLRAQALDEGYTAEYGNEFLGMEPELPVRDCELVRDILDMFRVIRASVNRLGPGAVAGLEHAGLLEFAGFDANDPLEGRLLYYARHLLETDRWTDLADYFDHAHDGGNSHHQVLPSYRRMLEAYEPLFKAKARGRGLGPDHFLFSAGELAAIASAAVHPSADRTVDAPDRKQIGQQLRSGLTPDQVADQAMGAKAAYWMIAIEEEARLENELAAYPATPRSVAALRDERQLRWERIAARVFGNARRVKEVRSLYDEAHGPGASSRSYTGRGRRFPEMES
jgi:uncharacterized protein YfbU (UPF0304 family)